MRSVEQFAQTLGAILQLKQSGRFDEALVHLDDAYRQHTGSDSSLIHRLPAKQLLDLLKTSGRLDVERCLFIAELLRAETEVRHERDGLVPVSLYAKALDLYLDVLQAEALLLEPYGDRVGQLLTRLNDADVRLSPATQRRLFAYHTSRGAYAQAEDALFRLLEQLGPVPELLTEGHRFYEGLLALPDEALKRGNLPRMEVLEGLTALREYPA
jgi:tetratricopeptide (TPR) repeat protein